MSPVVGKARSGLLGSARGPWGRVWWTALVVVLLCFGSLEAFWRSRGYLADMFSYEDLWAYHRDRIVDAGRDTVALLGGSRMQIGFRPEAFVEVHPQATVVQLADAGKSPLAALADVAADESFAGLVICALPEVTTLPSWTQQTELVEYYREEWTPGQKYSLLLAAPFEMHLVMLQPRLRGTKLVSSLSRGELPPVNYYRTYFDRTRDMYFGRLTRKNIRSLIRIRIDKSKEHLPPKPPASPDQWRMLVERLVEHSARIDARGGAVVYVQFPIRGSFRKLNDLYFPRTRYWDRLAAAGLTTLHFTDMPGQRRLRLPDHSHLEVASARRFTRWIAEEVGKRRLLGAPADATIAATGR